MNLELQHPTSSDFSKLDNDAYVRQSGLIRSRKNPNGIVPVSAATLWRKVRNGTFPAPVKLSDRITAWRVGDIRAWLTQRTQGVDGE
jgi:prophage regulatory protein